MLGDASLESTQRSDQPAARQARPPLYIPPTCQVEVSRAVAKVLRTIGCLDEGWRLAETDRVDWAEQLGARLVLVPRSAASLQEEGCEMMCQTVHAPAQSS